MNLHIKMIKFSLNEVVNLTKKQHYVWRNYLKEWTLENKSCGSVYAKLPSNKIEKTNLENICSKKYFYTLPILNEFEYKCLKEFISVFQDDIKNEFDKYIDVLYLFGQRNSKLFSGDFSFKLRAALGEAFQKVYESDLSDNIKESIFNLDGDFINKPIERYKFTSFLISQFFRTDILRKKMGFNIENVRNKFSEYSSINSDNIWKALMPIIVASCAKTALKQKRYVLFLTNKTKIGFVTTDQPIISIGQHVVDGVDIFYYPISPKLALIFSSNHLLKGIVDLKESEVIDYNRRIINEIGDNKFIIFPQNYPKYKKEYKRLFSKI